MRRFFEFYVPEYSKILQNTVPQYGKSGTATANPSVYRIPTEILLELFTECWRLNAILSNLTNAMWIRNLNTNCKVKAKFMKTALVCRNQKTQHITFYSE